MFRVTKCHDNQLLHRFIKELSIFPKWISNGLFKNGFKIAIHDKDIIENGIILKNYDNDTLLGRTASKTTAISFPEYLLNVVDFEKQDREYEEFTSMIIHEISHAIDYFLGENDFWSIENRTILGMPIDDFAAINPLEQFAQALEGYFQSENKRTGSYWKYWHTKDEVYEKAPKLFEYFGQLLKEIQ